MIDKYAEIQERALLYNACKGVLRVKLSAMQKQASPWSYANIGGVQSQPSQPVPAPDPDAMYKMRYQGLQSKADALRGMYNRTRQGFGPNPYYDQLSNITQQMINLQMNRQNRGNTPTSSTPPVVPGQPAPTADPAPLPGRPPIRRNPPSYYGQ